MANCRFLATRDMNILPIDKDFAMRKLLSTFCATALAASVAATGVLPASAGPVFMPKAPASEHTGVIQIRDRSSTAGDGPIWKKRFSNNNNFSNNNFRGRNWNGNNGRNWDNGNWNNGRKYGWYNGHRGYRYKRQGDRYHDGFWFPAGAFIAGAIIGGAIPTTTITTAIGVAATTCSIAMIAIVPTGLRTIPSSPTTARASSAIRPIADIG